MLTRSKLPSSAVTTPVPRAEWPALAHFIHHHNRRDDGRARCLHAEHGMSAEDQAQEMLALPEGEAVFLALRRGDQWRGVIGAEVDHGLARAWVRGPLIAAADPTTAAAERALLHAALMQVLPAVERFDAFLHVDEDALRNAARAAGYRDDLQHHVMALRQAPEVLRWPATVIRAHAHHLDAVAVLHEQTFPESYLSGQRLREGLDDSHGVLVALRDGAVVGYLVIQAKPLAHEASIDFLGVAPEFRGAGLGRDLLDAAVLWGLREHGLPQVALTVRQDRRPALGLYATAGFKEVTAGAHMILQRRRP